MRDFFYNKGDILIAVLIILAAAVVIYWRVGVVMDYSVSGKDGESLLPPLSSIPAMITGEDGGSGGSSGGTASVDETAADPADHTPSAETEPPTEEDPANTADPTNTTDPTDTTDPADTTDPTDTTDPANDPADPSTAEEDPQTPPAEASPVTITVSTGDVASTIADKLLSVGAIADKKAFLEEVLVQGADSKLKTGTFTIPAGSTYAEIITILVG